LKLEDRRLLKRAVFKFKTAIESDEGRVIRDGKHEPSRQDLDPFPVCSSSSPYSKTAGLGPFEISDHQVLISSPPSISLPKLFLSVELSSPSYPFNRGSLQMLGGSTPHFSVAKAWRTIHPRNQQLPIMNSHSPTNRQSYAPSILSLNLVVIQQRVVPTPEHNLGTRRM
jgi:hypothetical protein